MLWLSAISKCFCWPYNTIHIFSRIRPQFLPKSVVVGMSCLSVRHSKLSNNTDFHRSIVYSFVFSSRGKQEAAFSVTWGRYHLAAIVILHQFCIMKAADIDKWLELCSLLQIRGGIRYHRRSDHLRHLNDNRASQATLWCYIRSFQ